MTKAPKASQRRPRTPFCRFWHYLRREDWHFSAGESKGIDGLPRSSFLARDNIAGPPKKVENRREIALSFLAS